MFRASEVRPARVQVHDDRLDREGACEGHGAFTSAFSRSPVRVFRRSARAAEDAP
jgi:hypothetical protein